MGSDVDVTRGPVVFQGIRSYIQGPGVVRALGAHLAALGVDRRVCIVIDRTILALLDPVRKSLEGAGLRCLAFEFDGDLQADTVARFAGKVRSEWDPGIVLGVGGGKAIDVSKIVAQELGARLAVFATSSSTDAAPSHAAVLLDQRHQIDARTLDRNPDLVVVDSEIVASAPPRLFAAGIGDAISKKYEMETAVGLGEANAFGGVPAFFVSRMAAALHECLLADGVEAVRSVRAGTVTDAVERVITACVLLSCLVWENGGLAGAHSIANVLFNAGHGARNLHGEMVAFSLLVLLLLEGKDKDLGELIPFYRLVGLPRKISDLGIQLQGDAVPALCEAVHARYRKHNILYSAQLIRQTVEELERSPS
jgi:glycerol dehydrogenase